MSNISEREQEVLRFWQDNRIFEKSLEQTKDNKPFVFYDGPPFATGTPHYGHLLQSVIKDAIPRYKTMRGFYVKRQWGWDCHGLPIENIVEKELGTKTKKEILAMGVKKFNDLCRERVFGFIHEWEKVIPRFGRWADMQNPYRTMDFEYMQSEWWAFKTLYKKGLIYEDYRSMHICPRCETTLSQGEVADGYKTVKDLSVTAKFRIKHSEKIGLAKDVRVFLLAWTTTPWTLPGNVALAIGSDIVYVVIEYSGELFMVAKERVAEVFSGKEGYREVASIKGANLMGLEYEPLFNDYSKDEQFKNRQNGWRVYAADFVTTEDGTGIVHIAPAFGTDDMMLGKKENLPFVQHVKMDGTVKPEVLEFPGLDLKPRAKDKPEEIREADLKVVDVLENRGGVFSFKKYEHSYPHCWRCDTALLNYATSSWFVAVEKIKPKLLKTAKKINWSPEHIKEGRFGQWLAGARDWSISRQRFWANTIPVWRCEQCKKETVFGSAAELEKASGVAVTDLHKDVVDEVALTCSCGGRAQRVPDVLDTWFDSGSMPFATKNPMPADFIGEAQDMTRAWFYYLHVMSGALFGKPAFKNANVTGIVLAEDGKKMSKKLKNYPDPSMVMEKYGADAMRFYILSSPVVQAENLFFSEKGVDEIAKKNLGRLDNVLAFYRLYADGTPANADSSVVLDQWILARLKELVAMSTQGYEDYQLDVATRPVSDFIDDLSIWYLRRSRERFKEESQDKKVALATLRYVLQQTALVIAPSMPFFAEYLFGQVKDDAAPESVHLATWPKTEKIRRQEISLVEQMKEVRSLVALALAERAVKALKVKQPLASLKIRNSKSEIRNEEALLDLIKDEINVKEIIFSSEGGSASGGDGTMEKEVELDTVITEELRQEGMLREVIRDVQQKRKEANLKPEDRITADISVDEALAQVLEKNKQMLLKEMRANDMAISIGDHQITIKKV